MNLNELVNPELISLVIFLFGYLLYYFSYESQFVLRLAKKLGDTHLRKEYATHIPRIIGFFTLGLIPALMILSLFDLSISEYGFRFPQGRFSLIITVILLGLTIFVSVIRPTKGINIDFYPQVRLQQWTGSIHLRNVVSWTLYLLSYEFMLRGVLFFSCLHAYGLIPAIVINSVIYSLIHIYKGKGEAFGAFFLGILLCLAAYYTNSFFLPFVVHVILAIGNDIKALKAAKTP